MENLFALHQGNIHISPADYMNLDYLDIEELLMELDEFLKVQEERIRQAQNKK